MNKTMSEQDKQYLLPPQNIESEKALLGSIMLRNEVLHDVVDIIRDESFYVEKHKTIWQAIFELFSKGEPIDLLSLSNKLEENKQLSKVGGRSYLAELAQDVPSSANAEHYAHIVHKKFMMRGLIKAAQEITRYAYEDSIELEETLENAEKQVFDITNIAGSNKFLDSRDILGEAFERYERLHSSQDEMRGISTGFDDLDHMLAGFQKSDLIILAARPSMGKTSLALDIARQASLKSQVPVGIFSLEMSSQQLIDRMIAAQSQVDAWKLRTGKLSADTEFDKIREALNELSKAPIYIDDQPGNNILKMRSIARRLKSEKGLGLIIVDYLQLMVPTRSMNSDNVVQQVTEISRSLKNLARELDVPVLALSQLSRAVESRGGKPRLSDLRDSGSIEQDADVVMFIHREDKFNEDTERPNIAEVLIEKHRNGPVGRVELYFDEKKSSFLSVTKSDYGQFAEEFDPGF
ncbi:MAG: replicative DNA helicase [Candidatus Campbellbacteria bacterium]|nr:replicative DNA helicase [Candidatus Campbellbacteria bacterium]